MPTNYEAIVYLRVALLVAVKVYFYAAADIQPFSKVPKLKSSIKLTRRQCGADKLFLHFSLCHFTTSYCRRQAFFIFYSATSFIFLF